MITGLDHPVLICRDIDAAVRDFSTLFGRPPVWRDENDALKSAMFQTENTGLEIIAAANESVKAHFDDMLDGQEARLTSLAFRTNDIDNAHHSLSRRGLSPEGIRKRTLTIGDTPVKWQSFRCDDDRCAGIKTFVLDRELPEMTPVPDNMISYVDHVVVNTPNPTRAIAQYGARLGLRFALDRTAPDLAIRFLFFRVGGVTLEVTHPTKKTQDPNDPDSLWGITWGVGDIDAAHLKMSMDGISVSPVRMGRKPGSHVFTVKSHTQGIPTLVISHQSSVRIMKPGTA